MVSKKTPLFNDEGKYRHETKIFNCKRQKKQAVQNPGICRT
jgi:hypothetical protein